MTLQPDKLTPAQRAKWDADHEAVNAPGFDPVAFHQDWLDNLTDDELAANRPYWRTDTTTADELRAAHAAHQATGDLVGQRAASVVRWHVARNQLAGHLGDGRQTEPDLDTNPDEVLDNLAHPSADLAAARQVVSSLALPPETRPPLGDDEVELAGVVIGDSRAETRARIDAGQVSHDQLYAAGAKWRYAESDADFGARLAGRLGELGPEHDQLKADHDFHAGCAIVLDGQIAELGGKSMLE